MADLESIKLKIADLQVSLEKSLPGYAGVLNFIHKQFQEQPELMYKLADEEIAVVIQGLEKIHKVEIIETKAKKPISKKQGSMLNAEDV